MRVHDASHQHKWTPLTSKTSMKCHSPIKPATHLSKNATHLSNLCENQIIQKPRVSMAHLHKQKTFFDQFSQSLQSFEKFNLLWFHSLVCCFRVLHWHCVIITWQLVTIVAWDPCILFEPEIFVRFACRDQRDGTYLKIASIGKQMMATICILSLEKSAKE